MPENSGEDSHDAKGGEGGREDEERRVFHGH